MASETMNLWQKMAYVSANVGAVTKDGKHSHSNYNFQSIEAVSDALRGLMAEVGLVMFSSCTNSRIEENHWVCSYVFTFVDSETGTSKECHWEQSTLFVSKKGGINDKAMGINHSYAQKYFLMRTFLISSNEDLDENSDVDNDSGKKVAQGKKKAQQPKSASTSTGAIPYEKLTARRKKVYDVVNSHFDEDFGKYMKFCEDNGVDWNNKSADIIETIRKAI